MQSNENVSLPARTEVATLAGGCFWCLEAVFVELRGVQSVVSGFAGGHAKNASYRQVCSGTTGHAEVVQVTFDPAAISYRELLEVFFVLHDPTTLNRQGADVGTQYRSAIFYHSAEQRDIAQRVKDDFEAAKVWDGKILTEIAPFDDFIRAEDYHQNYYANNMSAGYCRVVIAPKVAKLRKVFVDKLKTAPQAKPQPAMT